MIEIKIPKEVTKYEAKLIGPFTARQCIALAIFVPIAVLTYNLARNYLSSAIAPYLCILVATPGALFGWVKPYGLKFEEFAKSVVLNGFIAPSKRVHKSESYYDLLSKAANELTPEEQLVLDAVFEDLSKEEIEQQLKAFKKGQKKRKNSKKQKYKKSSKAIF